MCLQDREHPRGDLGIRAVIDRDARPRRVRRRAAGRRVQFEPSAWLRGHSPRPVSCRWLATTAPSVHGHHRGRSAVSNRGGVQRDERRSNGEGRQRRWRAARPAGLALRERAVAVDSRCAFLARYNALAEPVEKIVPEALPDRPVVAAINHAELSRPAVRAPATLGVGKAVVAAEPEKHPRRARRARPGRSARCAARHHRRRAHPAASGRGPRARRPRPRRCDCPGTVPAGTGRRCLRRARRRSAVP